MAIIEKYKDVYPESPYLLPIIQDPMQNEYRQYSRMLRLLNYRLRQVGYFLKIREQLSTYVARHTWATTALRQNYNSSLICDAMGHSSVKVTETYFQRYREEEVNQLNNALVAFVLSKFSLLWLLLAVIVVCACSKSNESSGDTEKAGLTFQVNFDKTGMEGRAPQSTAIPETSWDNIKQLQFLLYNTTGDVVYSAIVNSSSSLSTFTYTDVPVGTGYTLVAVANVKSSSDAIVTSLDGGTTGTEWTMWNVRQKPVSSLTLTHQSGGFPSFCNNEMTTAGNKAYTEPSEIFMGSATGIDVTAGVNTPVPAISLKREVAMLRVRLNVKDSDTDNQNTVDFTQNASIMIFRLPKDMKVMHGNTEGVNSISTETHVLSIKDGTVFKTSNPISGYSYSTTNILNGNFTMWRDVIVFPNNGGRAINGGATAEASTERQYFIVVSGLGKNGHVLADGNTLTADTPIYWSGLIKENFTPNTIREVNLTLRSGGTTVVPVKPRKEGGLIIDVDDPEAWSSNIVESALVL